MCNTKTSKVISRTDPMIFGRTDPMIFVRECVSRQPSLLRSLFEFAVRETTD